ncbi:MAG TPA: hypothetical protein VFS43_32515 [Polyangiaceae bacterium]|nr:hypothetical protein [Polyangiaceae bacterium]
MRRLRRPALSAGAADFLAKRTAVVAKAAKAAKRAKAAEAAAEEVKRLWGQKANKAFDEIRQTLASMASGRDRCMYCEDNQGTGIDHFRPKAHYPFDAFSWPNYLLACSSCNSNDKRDQFPLDAKGKPLLIDPTAEDPLRHLALTTKTGELVSRTRKGRKSIEVFGLDRQLLNDGRRAAWLTIERHIVWYAQCRRLGRNREARVVEWLIRKESFSSVLSHLVRMASTPDEAKSIRPECRRALRQCREILTWVS